MDIINITEMFWQGSGAFVFLYLLVIDYNFQYRFYCNTSLIPVWMNFADKGNDSKFLSLSPRRETRMEDWLDMDKE